MKMAIRLMVLTVFLIGSTLANAAAPGPGPMPPAAAPGPGPMPPAAAPGPGPMPPMQIRGIHISK